MAMFATIAASSLFQGASTVAAIGSAVGGVGSVVQGFSQGRALDRRADQEITAAGARARMLNRDNRRQAGATRAAMAASGLTITGSPLDLIADQANLMELNEQLTRYDGQVRAATMRDRADQARLGGLVDGVGSAFQAGTTLLGDRLDFARIFGNPRPQAVGGGGGGLSFGGLVGSAGGGLGVLV
jgi:hypothetical protein